MKPQNATREITNPDGLCNFKVDYNLSGVAENWFGQPLETTVEIGVPSSYNDLFADESIRDHVGHVWYQRAAHVPGGGMVPTSSFGLIRPRMRAWCTSTTTLPCTMWVATCLSKLTSPTSLGRGVVPAEHRRQQPTDAGHHPSRHHRGHRRHRI